MKLIWYLTYDVLVKHNSRGVQFMPWLVVFLMPNSCCEGNSSLVVRTEDDNT